MTGPRRKARHSGNGALPARAARTARGSRVTPRQAGRPTANPKDDTMRPRSRRPALAPLAGSGARKRPTARRCHRAGHRTRPQASNPRRTWRLRDHCLPGRLTDEGT
jgi:hypothetical protein